MDHIKALVTTDVLVIGGGGAGAAAAIAASEHGAKVAGVNVPVEYSAQIA
ncbi:MAG: FAD-binding protein [Defluviitaleaceae bacterium]|nr:FAD-binding protein [Defluviitaleaceae bacterium]